MFERAFGQKFAGFVHGFEHSEVAVAELAVLRVDLKPRKKRNVGAKFPIIGDIIGDFYAVGGAEIKVVFPMAGGDVDKARSGIFGDEISKQ